MNYGIGQLPVGKIEADLDFLRQHFDQIRVTYPNFDSASVPYWQDICLRAKAKGFNVMWGISCKATTSNKFDDFCDKLIELAPWAEANNVTLGVNEEMYHNDDLVISDGQVLDKLHTTAVAIKSNNPNVKLIISLAGDGELDKFIAGGSRGAWDYVGVNQYGTQAQHRANIDKLVNTYGRSHVSVTEFNTGRGFDPLFGNEVTWKSDIKTRMDYMKPRVESYFGYTYADNQEQTSSGTNKWNFRTASDNSTHHEAFDLFMV